MSGNLKSFGLIVTFNDRLSWQPSQYGNLTKIQLPGDALWKPELVLYNNADGNYEATYNANAIVYNNGTVEWTPPAVFHSSCRIRVRHFPFDVQRCEMQFQSWVYPRKEVQLIMMSENATKDDFTESGEWNIVKLPGRHNNNTDQNGVDSIRFYLVIERKPLFYTVNLIIPCMLITSLAIFVFVLPSESGKWGSLKTMLLTQTMLCLIRRKNVSLHLCSTSIDGFPTTHIKADSSNQFGCTANWSLSDVYNGLGYRINCCVCLRFEHSLPWSVYT